MTSRPPASAGSHGGSAAAGADAVGVLAAAALGSWGLSALCAASPAVTALSVVSSLVIPGAAAWTMLRRRERITSADRVTLVRVALTGVLTAALVLTIVDELPSRTWTVLIAAAVATSLDAVDGWVARHTGTSTEAGARFDVEADAAALLVLSALLAMTVGWWVLLIGLMRYLFLAVSLIRPVWQRPSTYSRFRKAVAAFQATALVVGLAPVVPVALAASLAVAALGLLLISFGRDVFALERADRADRADGSATGKTA